MPENASERIVLDIPVRFTAEGFAGYCSVSADSIRELLDEALPLVNEWAAPKALLRWANTRALPDGRISVDGTVFDSRVVSSKLSGVPRVILGIITAGRGLERCPELADPLLLDVCNGALIRYAMEYTTQYMKDTFGFDGASRLAPGSLPDWPVKNNFALFDAIGHPEEIGVSLDGRGYIRPWNSVSGIHFPGDGYHNCSLCKKYDCVGRRAPFDRGEYVRIFGVEP